MLVYGIKAKISFFGYILIGFDEVFQVNELITYLAVLGLKSLLLKNGFFNQ